MSQAVRLTLTSETSTKAFAQRLAAYTHAPLILTLEGDLGSGKTTFSRYLIQSLTKNEALAVQSPSYAIARSYPGPPLVHHIDLYRLGDPEELDPLGISEMFTDENRITIIEWPNRFPSLKYPEPRLHIAFEFLENDARLLTLSLMDDNSSERLELSAFLEQLNQIDTHM